MEVIQVIRVKIGSSTSATEYQISSELLEMIRSFITAERSSRETAKNLLLVYINTLKDSVTLNNEDGIFMMKESFPFNSIYDDSLTNDYRAANVSFYMTRGLNQASNAKPTITCPSGYINEFRFLMGEPVGIKYKSDGTVDEYGTPFTGTENMMKPDVVVKFNYCPKTFGCIGINGTGGYKVNSLGTYQYSSAVGRLISVGKDPELVTAAQLSGIPVKLGTIQGDEWNITILTEELVTSETILNVVRENLNEFVDAAVLEASSKINQFYVSR